MGYYTKYDLSVQEGNLNIKDILEQVEGEFEPLEYAIGMDGEYYDAVKWYDHESDMKWLSEKFHDIVFKLEGEGEEAGDIWKKYFKNGYMQKCPAKITFDEYDETKLK